MRVARSVTAAREGAHAEGERRTAKWKRKEGQNATEEEKFPCYLSFSNIGQMLLSLHIQLQKCLNY